MHKEIRDPQNYIKKYTLSFVIKLFALFIEMSFLSYCACSIYKSHIITKEEAWEIFTTFCTKISKSSATDEVDVLQIADITAVQDSSEGYIFCLNSYDIQIEKAFSKNIDTLRMLDVFLSIKEIRCNSLYINSVHIAINLFLQILKKVCTPHYTLRIYKEYDNNILKLAGSNEIEKRKSQPSTLAISSLVLELSVCQSELANLIIIVLDSKNIINICIFDCCSYSLEFLDTFIFPPFMFFTIRNISKCHLFTETIYMRMPRIIHSTDIVFSIYDCSDDMLCMSSVYYFIRYSSINTLNIPWEQLKCLCAIYKTIGSASGCSMKNIPSIMVYDIEMFTEAIPNELPLYDKDIFWLSTNAIHFCIPTNIVCGSSYIRKFLSIYIYLKFGIKYNNLNFTFVKGRDDLKETLDFYEKFESKASHLSFLKESMTCTDLMAANAYVNMSMSFNIEDFMPTSPKYPHYVEYSKKYNFFCQRIKYRSLYFNSNTEYLNTDQEIEAGKAFVRIFRLLKCIQADTIYITSKYPMSLNKSPKNLNNRNSSFIYALSCNNLILTQVSSGILIYMLTCNYYMEKTTLTLINLTFFVPGIFNLLIKQNNINILRVVIQYNVIEIYNIRNSMFAKEIRNNWQDIASVIPKYILSKDSIYSIDIHTSFEFLPEQLADME
ncbi:hypothetical protein NEFER03_0975 [Nematocida sp. LUAm3]|nr:hypothetical protein NEFER03_0975 [Nematocida sp. LUAm3]KAI5175421.1 hypothetical protein NEFER02_1350 [Nematocida sp. LUAm2]KAI5177622.1 hypothetical protein NEFER01_0846 [Nematocida sp. LUAm1]